MFEHCVIFNIYLGHQPKGDACPKTRRIELQETVQHFYDNFRQVYVDLRHKYSQELQQFSQQRPLVKKTRKVAWT